MSPSEILERPATGAHFLIRKPRTDVVFDPGETGYWEHPDFRWPLIPEETGMNQYFIDAGFELTVVDRDLPLDRLEQGSIGWNPEQMGDGWILVLVVDTEDGPQAVFARRI